MSMPAHDRMDFELRNVINSYINHKGFAVIEPVDISLWCNQVASFDRWIYVTDRDEITFIIYKRAMKTFGSQVTGIK